MMLRTRLSSWASALTVLAIGIGGGVSVARADDQSTTYRRYDEQGHFEGTVRDTGDHRLRFYDEKGEFSGSAREQPDGTWRVYDARGAFNGTVREDEQ
jgi:hypothetical protein